MMKIYLIAGHQGANTGAKGIECYDEGEMTIELRDDLARNLRDAGVQVVTDDNYTPLRSVLNWLGSLVSTSDLIVDIHFNAFHNPNANGTEVLIPNDANGRERMIAYNLLDAMVSALGTRNRGIKKESQSQHSRIGILSGKPHAANNVLLEVCFITNKSDVLKYEENYGELLRRVSNVLIQYAKG